jgi:hypothetical protein
LFTVPKNECKTAGADDVRAGAGLKAGVLAAHFNFHLTSWIRVNPGEEIVQVVHPVARDDKRVTLVIRRDVVEIKLHVPLRPLGNVRDQFLESAARFNYREAFVEFVDHPVVLLLRIFHPIWSSISGRLKERGYPCAFSLQCQYAFLPFSSNVSEALATRPLPSN